MKKMNYKSSSKNELFALSMFERKLNKIDKNKNINDDNPFNILKKQLK